MKRKLLVLFLSLMLVASMEIPAFAAEPRATCTLYGSKSSKSATATAEYTGYTVRCQVGISAWCSAHTEYISKSDSKIASDIATVTVDSRVTSADGYYHWCYIQSAWAKAYNGSALLKSITL